MKLNPMTLHLTDDQASPDAGAPWWARFVYRIGIPSAFAVFLVWFLAVTVKAELTTQRELLQGHINGMEAQRQELSFYLQSICLNTATTETQRAQCMRSPVR